MTTPHATAGGHRDMQSSRYQPPRVLFAGLIIASVRAAAQPTRAQSSGATNNRIA